MNIKICGLTTCEETEYLNRNHVSYAGMVLFFQKSKRNIDIARASEIMAALDDSIKKVAVVVSPSVDQARAICSAGFDIIQIHGLLSEEVYDAITIDIWKAFNVKDMDQYETWANREKVLGYVFDSSEPGSGVAFNHELLDSIPRPKDKLFILAGGLNSDNVVQAVQLVNPDVIDVSSGVEYGKDIVGKDPDKVDAFCNAIRGIG